MQHGRQTENKLVLVVRQTRLDELVARFNSMEQARFYVEHMGSDFSDYVREHERYYAALAETERILQSLGRVHRVARAFLPNFVFGPADTVVVLGQDGLVVNTAKYLNGQPIVGVNPDPDRWDGVLLPFAVPDLSRAIPELFAGRRPIREVTMAKAQLNNAQTLYAVNDLFIGRRTHTSARYQIQVGAASEHHSSSGIIVSTGVGSTGWLKSVLAGAAGIMSAVAQRRLTVEDGRMDWDAPYLYYSVREPFPSKTTAASLVFGRITADSPMRLVSQMPEDGVIFSDGVEADFLEFTAGVTATIGVADKRVRVVI